MLDGLVLAGSFSRSPHAARLLVFETWQSVYVQEVCSSVVDGQGGAQSYRSPFEVRVLINIIFLPQGTLVKKLNRLACFFVALFNFKGTGSILLEKEKWKPLD